MPALQIRTTGIEDYLDDSGRAFIKALVMGQASAGKTRSASFWPKPFFVDCEKGRMSISDRKAPYVEVGTSDEMGSVLDLMKFECKKPYDQRKYLTFVLDTLDSYQRKVIAERLAAEHKEALSGWADWGYLDAKMSMLVEALLNLDMNIVVNLHIKEKGSHDDDKPTTMEPKLKGDIRDQIANEFDLVGHMATYWEAVNGERTLVRGIKWVPEPAFPILKDRSGHLPAFTPVTFTEADYTNLLAHFQSGAEGLTPGESVGEIKLPEPPKPASTTVRGGPVPAPKAEDLPRSAAKKTAAKTATPPAAAPVAAPVAAAPAPVAAAPAPVPPAAPVAATPAAPPAAPPVAAPAPAAPAPTAARNVPPAARPVEVVERGQTPESAEPTQPGPVPAAAPAEPTPVPSTPVAAPVAPTSTEPAQPEPTEQEAEALLAANLGATPVESLAEPSAPVEPVAPPVAAPVAAEPAQPAAPAEEVILCGTPGKMKDGSDNPEPVAGCGKNLREIAVTEEDRDRVNLAYLSTRTYLCPACFKAHKASLQASA